MQNTVEYTMLDAGKVRAITSSTNATPIEVTMAAHGLTTGDIITINGHATNTAANGTWVVTVTAATTVTLDDSVGNGVGGATGCWANAPKTLFCGDFDAMTLTFDTDGGGDAAFTYKLVGSIQDTPPDFADDQAANNTYEFISSIDYQSASGILGNTGFVVAGGDDHRLVEYNVSKLRWISTLATAGTEGEATFRVNLSHNA